MAGRPSSSTLSKESTIPVLEWKPDIYVHVITLTRMGVGQCDIAEVNWVPFEWHILVFNEGPFFVAFDFFRLDVSDFGSKVFRYWNLISVTLLLC